MSACPNCFHALTEPVPKHCGNCGQETLIKPPTVLEFIQHFGGAYLSTEGALWRTLRVLICRPGQLTLAYFAGRRRHYVLPLRLYLTISLITLLLMRISAGWMIELPKDAIQMDGTDSVQFIAFGAWRAGLDHGKFYCDGLPRTFCDRLERRISGDEATKTRELQEAMGRFFQHWGTAMFVLVPCFAVWTRLLYLNRKRVYMEHLVFALHLHAFWFLMVLISLSNVNAVQKLAWLASLVYPIVALQRVFPARWWSTAMRAVALMLLNVITLAFGFTAVLVITMVS